MRRRRQRKKERSKLPSMHMDTTFVLEAQHPITDEPAWSTLSPELSWNTLLLERLPNDTCQLINISEVKQEERSACDRAPDRVQPSQQPLKIKQYACRQVTKSTNPLRQLQEARLLTMSATNGRLKQLRKPWPNPNVSAKPKYGKESNNVFLKLQKRPLRNELFDPADEFVIERALPPPDDMDVQPSDSYQLSFFLRQVPIFMGCVCCLPQIADIFMESVKQPILRHSILALSTVVQQCQGSPANLEIGRNVQQIIPQIQTAIREVKFNDSHMVSVTFLAWLSLTRCDFAAAHRHIRGIVSMLKVTKHVLATALPARKKPNPLAMFLFCMAVKADNYLACRNQPLAIPPIQYNEGYHRQWLVHTTENEMHLQYSLATIQLDCLANNIAHLHHQAAQMRACGVTNIGDELARRVALLKKTHKLWPSRPYIQHHITANEYTTDSPPDRNNPYHPSRFLWHPAYIIFDPLVAYMHLNHTYLTIHMNLVLAGRIDPHDAETYDAAVLICRIYAALNATMSGNAGRTLNGCVGALWFAGIVFAHPQCSFTRGYPLLPWHADLRT